MKAYAEIAITDVTDGANGTSYYTYVRYSANSDGSNFVTTPTESTVYIGVYSGTSATAPTDKTSYSWSKYVGDKGDTGTSIALVTPLYYCSDSTTAPSAPTTTVTVNDISKYNQWNKALPTWTTTYKYYFSCDEILYSNNVYKWTTVVRNSALETANSTADTANSNANNTLDTLNNLDIGGENLVTGTLDLSCLTDAASSYKTDDTYRNTNVIHCLNNTTSEDGYINIYYKDKVNIYSDTYYTLSFWAKGNVIEDSSYGIRLYLMNSDVDNLISSTVAYKNGVQIDSNTTTTGRADLSDAIDDTWSFYEIVRKSGTYTDVDYYEATLYFARVYYGNEIYISNIKFEEGNKSTPWSLSQQDNTNTLNAQITGLSETTAASIKTVSDKVETVVGNYYSKSDGESLSSKVNSLQVTSDGFSETIESVQKQIETVNGTATENYQSIISYIRYDADLNTVFIGKQNGSDDAIELRLTPDKLSFYQGDNEVAYFSNHMLHFDNGAVDIQYDSTKGGAKLQLGNFAFIPRASGNLSFRKVVN